MTENSDSGLHPLEQIASRHDISNQDVSDTVEVQTSSDPTDAKPEVPEVQLILSPKQSDTPALIIDGKMQIVWHNKAAKNEIWYNASAAQNGNPHPNILDLLFDAGFKRSVENWRKWVRFFIHQAQHMLSETQLQELIQPREARQIQILNEILKQSPKNGDRIAYSGNICLRRNDGVTVSFGVVATQFKQGRYIIFKSTIIDNETSRAYRCADIEQRFEVIRRLGHPSPQSLYILAARLDKSRRLRTEMLAEEYSRLLTRLYKQTIEVVEKYGGMFQKLTGSEFLACFFTGPPHENQPRRVIDCALELKGQMSDLGREWKIRKGWLHNLELDIGLHWSEEYIGTITSSLGDHLATFGNTQGVATILSHLACEGQIWATKDLINQIPPSEQKKLRFGIFRKGRPNKLLISKYFSRLRDIPTDNPILTTDLSGEIGDIAATQIFDQQS